MLSCITFPFPQLVLERLPSPFAFVCQCDTNASLYICVIHNIRTTSIQLPTVCGIKKLLSTGTGTVTDTGAIDNT